MPTVIDDMEVVTAQEEKPRTDAASGEKPPSKEELLRQVADARIAEHTHALRLWAY